MVSADQGKHCTKFLSSKASLQTMGSFMKQSDILQLQKVNRDFYEKKVPDMLTKVQLPSLSIILEKNRKEVYIGLWKRETRELKKTLLFKCGNGNGEKEYDKERLGFEEIYFQYIHMEDPNTFYCWPMENEAILTVGYCLKFKNGELDSSTPLAALAPTTMRSTMVPWNSPSGKQIMMFGGQEHRWSQTYDIKTDTWFACPKLP